MDKKTFNSAECSEKLKITAPYYNAINPTMVFFSQENVAVSMDSLGHIEFFDNEEKSLGFVDLPVSSDPSKYAHSAQYGEIECMAENVKIIIFLPEYWWDDSYPNCDGESDRWTRHIDHWFRVVFDCETKRIEVLDR